MWINFGVLFCLAVSFVNASIPDYIKPCKRNAPDAKACYIKHGNEALPHLLKGDKQFKIPNLLPLVFPEVKVDAGPDLKISLKEVAVLGLDTVTLTDMEIDFDKKHAMLAIDASHVELIGNYDIDGKIMILPIQGNGPVNITVENGKFKYDFNYKLESSNGLEVAIIQPGDNLEFTIGKAYFRLDNLFNGNKQMGDNVNTFLNENWSDVLKELGGAVKGTITAIARNVGGGILANVPFKDLFLE